jgi:hypothetical protein
MLELGTTDSTTFEKVVKVRFATNNNTWREGDFKATFKRISKTRLDELLDADAGYTQTEVLDEVLVGVSGIGRRAPEGGGFVELPPDEALAYVRDSVECCNATFRDFFMGMRQADGDVKTSKKPR